MYKEQTIKLKPYQSTNVFIKNIIIAFLVFIGLGWGMYGIASYFGVDFKDHPEVPIVFMMSIVVFINIWLYRKFYGKKKTLRIFRGRIAIVNPLTNSILEQAAIDKDKIKKVHFVFANRMGMFTCPGIVIEFDSRNKCTVAGLGHTFRWEEETIEVQKPDYTVDMINWQKIIEAVYKN